MSGGPDAHDAEMKAAIEASLRTYETERRVREERNGGARAVAPPAGAAAGSMPTAPPIPADEAEGLDPEADAAVEQQGEAKAESNSVQYECPVCLEDIDVSEAAMRCSGTSGVHHYFHAHCMSQWMEQSRGRGEATCPLCRGPVEVHPERLSNFLSGNHSRDNLSEPERSNLEGLLHGIREGWKGEWSKLEMNITPEQVVEGVSIVAAAGVGFYHGAHGSAPSTGSMLVDAGLWNAAPTSAKIAAGVGWAAGAAYSAYRWLTSDKDSSNGGDRERKDGHK